MTENPIDQNDTDSVQGQPPKRNPVLDFLKGFVVTFAISVVIRGTLSLIPSDYIRYLFFYHVYILIIGIYGWTFLAFIYTTILFSRGKVWMGAGIFTFVVLFYLFAFFQAIATAYL